MKRIVSIVLVACLLLGLLAGISISAFAAEEIKEIHITGLNTPVVGGPVVSADISGVPEGFSLEVQWMVYRDGYTEFYEEEAFADDTAYLMLLYFTAEDGSFLNYESDWFNFSVNGEGVDSYEALEFNEYGVTYFYIEKLYALGDITIVDEVILEQIPEAVAGANVNDFKVAEGCGYELGAIYWSDGITGESFEGTTLEEGKVYTASVYVNQQSGYCFNSNTQVYAPTEPDGYHVYTTNGYLQVFFTYDLRPSVDEVNVIGDFEYAYGDPATDEGLSIPADVNYSMDVQWYASGVEHTGVLDYDYYDVEITLIPSEGYSFRDDTAICVNGEEINYDEWNYHISDEEIWLSKSILIEPDNGFVDNVVLSDNPESITAGATISAPKLTVDFGEVTVTNTQWVDEEYTPVSGKFEDGKIYYLAVTMKANEGYGFRDQHHFTTVTVGDYEQYPQSNKNADGTATVYIRYTLKKVIKAADVVITEPVIGAAPAEPKVPSGANYTVENYHWYEAQTGDEANRFEDGKKYYVDVYLAPADGYEFAQEMALTVNGQEPYGYYSETDYANISHRYSFLEVIDRVDITMPEPKLGDEGSIENIEVPEDANYAIYEDESYWQAHHGEFTGTFEKDRYSLNLVIEANDGYEFAEDAVVYINGTEAEDYGVYNEGRWAGISYEVSFLEQISKVELPAFPTIKLGDALVSEEVDAPAGANYSISTIWREYLGEMDTDECNGVAEDKSVYYLVYSVTPHEGYEFAEDVVYTVGGKKVTSGVHYAYNDNISVGKMYSFGMKLISKIELTVDAPVKGATPGKITVPKDADYIIRDSSWGVSDKDALEDTEVMEGKFELGKYYWVQGVLQAKEGCIFAEDAVITVNGKVVDTSEFTTLTGIPTTFGNIAFAYHNMGKLGGSTIPPTGDSSAIILMTVLMVLSGTALAAVCISKKRAF